MSYSETKLPDRFFPASVLMWSRPMSEFLEAVARRGFQGAEVWAQHLERSGETAKAVRQRADELGLRLTVHAVSYDLNPLSKNPEIRELSRRQVMQSLIDGATMRAEIVVVHPGQQSSSTDDPEDYWPDLYDFCAALDERAALLGLKVGIEGMERKINQFFVEPTALNRLADEMEQREWSRLGLTVDMAHLATFTDPVEAFRQIRRIWHVHLSDGEPPKSTHRPLGLGKLPYKEMIATALDAGTRTITLEGRWRIDEEQALDRAAKELSSI